MSDLAARLKKNSVLKYTNNLSKSEVFNKKEDTPTDVPIINLALSGHFNKGFTAGLTMLAGPSKHFKSNLGLLCVSAYLKKHKEAVCIYYDSEFGCTPEYLEMAGIDIERVIHSPLENVEDLKQDLMHQLNNISKEDKVIVFIDSIGNLASKKEVDDAIDQKVVADFTKAKSVKSLWRMVCPVSILKDVPIICISTTYSEIGMFPKDILGGGTGNMYASNTVLFLSKAQVKEEDEIAGYKFTMKTEKSRYVKEQSKFPFIVTYKGGINIWSGLLDIALETGHVTAPTKGYYTRPSVEGDKKWRASATNCSAFWKPIFENTDFKESCTKKYALGQSHLIEDEISETDINALDTDEV